MLSRQATVASFLILVATLAAAPATGTTLSTSATTLVAGRADPRDGNLHTVVPFLELVTLRAYDFGSPALANAEIVLSGWGALVAGEPRDGKNGLGDLDLAYGEGAILNKHLFVRVGRQFVVPGAASLLQLDGANATLNIASGVGISGFAGAPVTRRFSYDQGDIAAGVRAFYRPRLETEIGLSFVYMYGHETVLRRDVGFDGRAKLLPGLALLSYVRYAVTEKRIVDGNLALHYQILPDLEVAAVVRRSAPDLFLPRYSIFSVFSQETRDEWGGFAYYRPVRWLDLSADFYQFRNEVGTGYNTSGRITGDLGRPGWHRFGVEGRKLMVPADGFQVSDGGYLMARAFGVERLTTTLSAIIDVSYYHFDNDLNGYPRSVSASGSIGWDFAPSWRAVVTGVLSETPFASHQVETLAKLVYNGRYVSTRKVD
jgi:hypothetical protein